MEYPKELTTDQATKLITVLEARFHRYRSRHENSQWEKLRVKIEA
ncbi:MAG: DUF4256 domain-containing protein, partial [Bacteroidia bacterium]|nr:DUF4256 domain-containing protein [Bacteroidia bacterium]